MAVIVLYHLRGLSCRVFSCGAWQSGNSCVQGPLLSCQVGHKDPTVGLLATECLQRSSEDHGGMRTHAGNKVSTAEAIYRKFSAANPFSQRLYREF
ncbi:STE20/SPS1-related proline-alanine-rich protein kinase [Fusarium oxysporum f. sp. albedinis]|nr:STE20/SPS1-related proline-alanine-rich protein kinase [Fusarium oxysporum f. sp. albedinis]